MKYIKTFEQYLENNSDDNISESKPVKFRGKKVSDLYKVIKDEDEVMVFAKHNHYSINDVDELKDDLHSDIVYVCDKDGEEFELKVSDIESINIDESIKTYTTFASFVNERSMLETSITDVVGLKQVRVVIEGPHMKKDEDKIKKIIDKHSPDNDVKYFPATDKMVGNVIKVKLEFITRDLKGIDRKIKMVEKPAKR